MTAALALNAVHEQRIATAVQASRAGKHVAFRVEDGDTAFITWHEGQVRRVIASGSLRQMQATLVNVQWEFQRQATAANKFEKESGKAVGV